MTSKKLITLIKERITLSKGWISFSEYMKIVLYEPDLGYYNNKNNIKFGFSSKDSSDFITAPELSRFFAISMARSISDALIASKTKNIMEIGAGSGVLALNILQTFINKNMLFDTYSIFEISNELKDRQKKLIKFKAPDYFKYFKWINKLPTTFEGVIIANEVLDSMPVRIFILKSNYNNKYTLKERGITIDKNNLLVFKDMFVNLEKYIVLNNFNIIPETYNIEIHETAINFTKLLCSALKIGAIFFIDYGFPRHEYYHIQRSKGTIMCHYRHMTHSNPLIHIGLQDITTHIDFTSIAEAGLSSGASILGYTSQSSFLINSGIIEELSKINPNNYKIFLPISSSIQKLVLESEMGELFKVIAFSKGIQNTIPSFSRGDRTHTLQF